MQAGICNVLFISINPAGTGTDLTMSTWSRHGQRSPNASESRSTRVCAIPGCMYTHGITWRTTACAWVHACLGCAWPHMGSWPHGKLPVGGCFHGHTCPCTHDKAWKGMYGSCGSMEAWSDMGPAPAVVCRCLLIACRTQPVQPSSHQQVLSLAMLAFLLMRRLSSEGILPSCYVLTRCCGYRQQR